LSEELALAMLFLLMLRIDVNLLFCLEEEKQINGEIGATSTGILGRPVA
jgi:hypothetical protein